MSEEDLAADWLEDFELDIEDATIEGDPQEAFAHVEARIAELETALEDLDVLDPQRGPVNLELGMLRAARDALRDHPDVETDAEEGVDG